MKKMTLRITLTVLAIAAAAALSGCQSKEAEKAGASETSEVSVHETTKETTLSETPEQQEDTAGEQNQANRAASADEHSAMAEIDISELSGGEIDPGSENCEDDDPEDTSEDVEEPEDEEDSGEDEEEEEEEEEDEEGNDDGESSEGEIVGYIGEIAPYDDGTYPCKVILVCTAENTSREKIDEMIAKYGLGIVYDYENLSMYAFSLPEPLDREATKKLLDELTAYDFILSAEPDHVIKLDDPVRPEPIELTTTEQ